MKPIRSTSRREWLAIAVMTLVGAVLRSWAFGRLSLSHFDEGIYALSGLWIAADAGPIGIGPMVIPYAPPGFPLLVGLSYLACGISDYSAILAATACGVATIPVVGWLGRRTFGPGAGAASASFAALSLAHVAFARKALTDAPFLLAWLVAIGLGGRFLEAPGFLRALVLGLAVGIAQNVKYNGWLAGALVIVAALVGPIARRDERRLGPLLRRFGWGLVAALTAALVYAPWFVFVSNHGGYAGLLRHHRSYLGGISSWMPHLDTQLGEALALSGPRPWLALTWILAWIMYARSAHDPWRFDVARFFVGWAPPTSRVPRPRWWAVPTLQILWLGLGALAIMFQANLPWWIGLGWAPLLLLSGSPSRRLLGTWWLVLSILTPFYHPYARLWLPLHAVGWLLMGGLFVGAGGWSKGADSANESRDDSSGFRHRYLLNGLALGCVGVSLMHLARIRPHPMPLSWVLEPTADASLRHFVFDGLPKVPRLEGKILQVLARRPLAFYLVLQGRYRFQLEPSLERGSQPAQPDVWEIVDEAILVQEGRSMDDPLLSQNWKSVVRYQTEADPVTLLDIVPHAAFQHHRERRFELWLLSPRVPPGARPDHGPGQSANEARHEP